MSQQNLSPPIKRLFIQLTNAAHEIGVVRREQATELHHHEDSYAKKMADLENGRMTGEYTVFMGKLEAQHHLIQHLQQVVESLNGHRDTFQDTLSRAVKVGDLQNLDMWHRDAFARLVNGVGVVTEELTRRYYQFD